MTWQSPTWSSTGYSSYRTSTLGGIDSALFKAESLLNDLRGSRRTYDRSQRDEAERSARLSEAAKQRQIQEDFLKEMREIRAREERAQREAEQKRRQDRMESLERYALQRAEKLRHEKELASRRLEIIRRETEERRQRRIKLEELQIKKKKEKSSNCS